MKPDLVKTDLIKAALGEVPAEVVYTGCEIFNPFICGWEAGSLAVSGGRVAGIGDYHGRREYDLHGARVVPGLIDSHVHIESSLLTPREYARLVLSHGTTTVVADPHEIANVCGAAGIEYMLAEGAGTPLDILIMLPSCVPAVPWDVGGAVLTASDLAPLTGREGVIGLGEVMNVPGVLSCDSDLMAKLDLCGIVDGHAPLLRGNALNAYISAGIRSDHECSLLDEAEEKLRRGMYIMMREGSTERNLRDLVPLVTPSTVSRCCFATDDRHVDLLAGEGHIDDCIRKAVGYGLEPGLAIRMATLSAAGRFGLDDRGALAPGRYADFCVLEDGALFRVRATYKRGVLVRDRGYEKPDCIRRSYVCRVPDADDIRIAGSGQARVIGLVEGQIITEDLRCELDESGVPDTSRDLVKAVVCDRYRGTGCGTGIVHGLRLSEGAIACSISHDAHNIVAAGVGDRDLLAAIGEVIRMGGGMVAVSGEDVTVLPLECAGLMSVMPYEEVRDSLSLLDRHVERMGGVRDAFMHLSFIALPVIPHLRLTTQGVFDVPAFTHVPLFSG